MLTIVKVTILMGKVVNQLRADANFDALKSIHYKYKNMQWPIKCIMAPDSLKSRSGFEINVSLAVRI